MMGRRGSTQDMWLHKGKPSFLPPFLFLAFETPWNAPTIGSKAYWSKYVPRIFLLRMALWCERWSRPRGTVDLGYLSTLDAKRIHAVIFPSTMGKGSMSIIPIIVP